MHGKIFLFSAFLLFFALFGQAQTIVITDVKLSPDFFPPQSEPDFNVVVNSTEPLPPSVSIDISVYDINSFFPLQTFSFPDLEITTVPATFDKTTFSNFVTFISDFQQGQYYAVITLFDDEGFQKDSARVFFTVLPLQQNPVAINDTHPLLVAFVAIFVLAIVLKPKK